jgi:outer membrane lipase/esterase
MKTNSNKIFLVTASIAFSLFGALSATSASGFSQFIGLGDSTLDSGYFRYHSMENSTLDAGLALAMAAGANGGFAGNGIMVTTMLAEKFGLNALPIDGGGLNYANGGSLTAPDPAGLSGNVPLTMQITNYLNSVNGFANPNALYVISSGNNDLARIATQPGLDQQSSALAASVRSLQDAGARYLLVPNSFRYANLASLGGEITGSDEVAAYTQLIAYNTQRWNDLTAAGVHYIPADLDSVFKYIVKNPIKFGFTPQSVLAANSPSPVPAVFSVLTEEQQQTYLIIDTKHLTTAGQTIEADYEYSLLTAPGEISLLAESAIQIGLSRTATIQRQIEISGKSRGPKGIIGWVATGANYLSTDTNSSVTDASGNPFQGTIGADYRTEANIILGGALSAGSTSQDFSTGGDFNQDNQTISAYIAYQSDQFWGNAVASYGLIQNDINRNVRLGRYTDLNHGDADGHSLALALRGGFDFKVVGQFATGPIIGVIIQEARIDGFTEHGTTGATSLTFDSQTRDSQITQIGWRGSIELGAWKPFAEVTWNHEFNEDDRTLRTALTSVSAPSYVSLATPIAPDWGLATLGTSYKFNETTSLWGSFSSSFGAEDFNNYGGEIGLRISF